jgi:hypothetical protein
VSIIGNDSFKTGLVKMSVGTTTFLKLGREELKEQINKNNGYEYRQGNCDWL